MSLALAATSSDAAAAAAAWSLAAACAHATSTAALSTAALRRRYTSAHCSVATTARRGHAVRSLRARRSPAANRHRPAPPATEGDGGCVGPGGCAAAASDRRTAAPARPSVRPSARRVVAPRAGRLHPQQPLRRHLARVNRHLPPLPSPSPSGKLFHETGLRYDTIRDAILTCARKPT